MIDEKLLKERNIFVYPFDRIKIDELVQEKKKFPKRINQLIDSHWEKQENCFNGDLISIEKIRIQDNQCALRLMFGDYKQYIGTESLRPKNIEKIHPLNYMMPLSFGVICETQDEYFILANRDRTHLNKDLYGFIPEGYFEPKDFFSANFAFNGVKRELEEEIGAYGIEKLKILGGVYENKVKNLYIAFYCKLKVKKAEIEFSSNEEFDNICFLEKEDFKRLCSEKFTDHNLGKIYLYMQQ